MLGFILRSILKWGGGDIHDLAQVWRLKEGFAWRGTCLERGGGGGRDRGLIDKCTRGLER